MHVDVDVDLGSAVISYGPAAGEERCLSAERAALFEAAPWPTFRWYFGRALLRESGTWWSSTMRDHVICESRLLLTPRHPAEADTIDTVRSLYERST